MTAAAHTVLFNGAGASRFLGHPEYWGRTAFKTGLLPIEGFVNAQFPAVSEATLKRLAPKLRKRKTIKLN
jgi:hypothetical protein